MYLLPSIVYTLLWLSLTAPRGESSVPLLVSAFEKENSQALPTLKIPSIHQPKNVSLLKILANVFGFFQLM